MTSLARTTAPFSSQTQRKLYELKCEFDCTEDLNSALVKTPGFVEEHSFSRLISKEHFDKWTSEQLQVKFELTSF